MLADFLIVMGQVATLFLMMGVGYFLAKRGSLTTDALGQMSHLLLYVVSPCIVISALQIPPTPDLLHALSLCFLALLISYLVYISLSRLAFRRQPEKTRGTLRFAMVYANTSFMGIPLIKAVIGDEGLIFCVVAMAAFNIFVWTHGAVLMGGRENASVKKALLNPGVLSLALGLLFFFTGFTLPAPVGNAVNYMSDLNTPLAMVVIGGQMACSDLGATFRKPQFYLAAAGKLLVMPALTALLLLPFHLDGIIYCTLVILSGCPTAGTTSIFAQQFNSDTATAAQTITLSTLLSILTLPVVAMVARNLSG